MDLALQNHCDLFIYNKNCLQSTFSLGYTHMRLGAACCLTTLNIHADAQRLTECKKLLKARSNLLSPFRKESETVLICKMSLFHNPDAFFSTMESFFVHSVQNHKWFASSSAALSSLIFADFASVIAPEQLLCEANRIYEGIRQQHRFMTNHEDYPFCATLAASNIGAEILLQDIAESFSILKQQFMGDVQSLSNALALCPMPAPRKCSLYQEIFSRLKIAKCGVSAVQYRAALAPLVMIPAPPSEIVQTITEIDAYLKHQKGFGFFSGVSSDLRHVCAAQIALNAYQCNSTLMNDVTLCAMLQYTLAEERQTTAST